MAAAAAATAELMEKIEGLKREGRYATDDDDELGSIDYRRRQRTATRQRIVVFLLRNFLVLYPIFLWCVVVVVVFKI